MGGKAQNAVVRDRLVRSVVASVSLKPLILALGIAASVVVARTLGPELFAVKVAFLAIHNTPSIVCLGVVRVEAYCLGERVNSRLCIAALR